MSEKLERWKAREKIRSDFGWIAVYLGLAGLVIVVGWLMAMFGSARPRVEGRAVWLSPLIGIGFLWSAVGLWKRPKIANAGMDERES